MRKLFYTTGSPFARAVRIVLAEKALDWEPHEEITTPSVEERARVAPTLQVPTLIDGDVRLWDSHVILDYLTCTYPSADIPGVSHRYADRFVRPDQEWTDKQAFATLQTLGVAITTISQLQWSGVKHEDNSYAGRCAARAQHILDWCESRLAGGDDGFVPGRAVGAGRSAHRDDHVQRPSPPAPGVARAAAAEDRCPAPASPGAAVLRCEPHPLVGARRHRLRRHDAALSAIVTDRELPAAGDWRSAVESVGRIGRSTISKSPRNDRMRAQAKAGTVRAMKRMAMTLLAAAGSILAAHAEAGSVKLTPAMAPALGLSALSCDAQGYFPDVIVRNVSTATIAAGQDIHWSASTGDAGTFRLPYALTPNVSYSDSIKHYKTIPTKVTCWAALAHQPVLK